MKKNKMTKVKKLTNSWLDDKYKYAKFTGVTTFKQNGRKKIRLKMPSWYDFIVRIGKNKVRTAKGKCYELPKGEI